MQISNTTSLLRFNFTNESQREALFNRLVEGQTLEARVMDQVSEGRWAVRFMGHTLVAESRLALAPGQRVNARVESLGPPLVLSLTGHAQAEDAAMDRAFQSLGLPDTAVNRAIVRGLMARGLPVERDSVQGLGTLLGGLEGMVDFDDIEALEAAIARAVFLRVQGLPVTPDTLATYLSQLPPGVLGGLFEGLAEMLRSFRGFGDAEREGKIHGLSLPDVGDLDGEGLLRLLRSFGVDMEGRLASWLIGEQDGLPEGVDDTLRASLLRLLGQLEGMNDRNAQVLMGRVREALQVLDTMQAANVPTGDREAIALQFPFVVDGDVATADVEIFYQKRGDGAIDPDNLRFALAVDLSGLGHVKFDLTVVTKRAMCRVYAEDEIKAAFLQEEVEGLKEALEKCGYEVADVHCRTVQQDNDRPPDQPPSVGVDFRV
jgi:hypothetical protein